MADPDEDTAEHQYSFDDEDAHPDGDVLAGQPVTTVDAEAGVVPRGGQHA